MPKNYGISLGTLDTILCFPLTIGFTRATSFLV